MTNSAVSTASPPSPDRAGANTGAGFWPSTAAMATRTIRKYFRTPQLIVLATVQSAMFLVIFRYVFGGAIDVGAQSYVDFLVPGFVTTVMLWTGMGSAPGVAEEVQNGLYDRLRSLPIPRASVIAGRCLADTVMVVWGLAVATGLGFAVGYRLGGSVTEGMAAFGLCALFGFAFTWLFITIGLLAGNAQAAQGFTLLVVPLTFISSAYVPTSSMPRWLQTFSDNQPVTPMVNAVRSLTGGPQAEALLTHDTSYYLGVSLLWTAAILLVFGLVAVVRISRR